MKPLNDSLPAGYTEATWTKFLHEKAHTARLLELRDFDWMSLDVETAIKIHNLLPTSY